MKNTSFLSGLILAACALLATSNLAYGQVGNDNPTGPAGRFNGNSTTGCSVDPYTANATRTVVDLTVAGAVGAYPLQWSRTMNSRLGYGYFGNGGGWLHSYAWGVTPHPDMATSVITPTSYDVLYPDGRTITFVLSTKGDTCYMGPPGVTDRLQTVHGTGDGYVIFADGGKLKFHQTCIRDPETLWYDYATTLTALIDPAGLTTTITTDANGTITQVTEPAGRWLKLTYTSGRISRVDGGYGTNTITQSVTYTYVSHTYGGVAYTVLEKANYISDLNSPFATYTYQASNIGSGMPLILTCDDVRYFGPMKKIKYEFVPGGVYGQLLSEDYINGTRVVTLSVSGSTRTETRGDGTHPTRTFTYGSTTQTGFSVPKPYLLGDVTDFKGVHTYFSYDTNSYLNKVKDGNGNITLFTRLAFTGKLSVLTHPGDASTVKYFYTDPTTGYYVDHVTDELSHTTTYMRDASNRRYQTNYPDGGSESVTFNSFNQVLTHVLKTGGTETFTYDSRGLKQTYRDPYHASGNATARYQYDSLDRVSGVTDALGSTLGDVNHTTSFTYNNRSQVLVTTHPVDPVDGQRHTVTNTYNSDWTLASVTDELGHVKSYAYDDYKRPLTVTTPGHNTPVTAYFYYDANGTGNDYSHTDSNVTHGISPLGRKVTAAYDENFRKSSVTAADGTADAATTSNGYDNVGNLTSIISPKEQTGQPFAGQNTVVAYDVRNRLTSVTDPLGNPTSCTYDVASRKTSATRANGQVTTFDSYDAMNRLLQQTAKQTPDPDAVTKYTYYSSGLLHTMQDPHLVATSSSYNYSYNYDQMGRKTSVTYPPDSSSIQRTESWHYDAAGRNDTFTNRAGNVQTATYDALYRPTNIAWNDGGVTPTVTVGYDVASRATSIVNANATIARAYFNDNLLSSETATYADTTARAVTYTYNADGDRATIQYPNGAYSFTYNYTNRDQLLTLVNNSGGGTVATYGYDPDGNLTTRTPDNGTSSAYTYDGMDRVTNISHALNGDTRTFDYDYDYVSNRKWTKRDAGTGDVFGYDLNDQATAVKLDIPSPDTTSVGVQTIAYDANGNRTTFSAYGPTDTYATNNLNQYISRNSNQATYNVNADMTTGVDASTYTYDAQNRLLTATKTGVTETFKYDGLNRQVYRKVGAGAPTYNIYDGWTLIGEYASGATTPSTAYLSGAGGLVKNLTTNGYYYQDASGSTSHLASGSGTLLEWYRYDLQGTPAFYDALNNQLSTSSYGVRHLFTGQQWYSELGLYDLRNRFYSPDIGRFLESDPIGFAGDPTNLYRYCGNNAVTFVDPSGLFFGEGTLAGAGGGAALGLFGGVAWGVTSQLISAANGNGFSSAAVENAAISGMIGGAIAGAAVGLVYDVTGNPALLAIVIPTATNIGGSAAFGAGGAIGQAILDRLSSNTTSSSSSSGSGNCPDCDYEVERVTVVGEPAPEPPSPPDWGGAGLGVPTGGDIGGGFGSGDFAALGPDAVYGSDTPAGNVFWLDSLPGGGGQTPGVIYK